MCRRVTCSKCGKPTWAGCGMHIEQALAGVPEKDRCHCGQGSGSAGTGTGTGTGTASNNNKPGAFASWFGNK